MSVYGSGGDYRGAGGQATAYAGGGYTAPPKVRFGVIGEAWQMFQQQMSTWIVAILLYLFAAMAIALVMYVILFLVILGNATGMRGDDSVAARLAFQTKTLAVTIPMTLLISVVAAYFMGGFYNMAFKQMRGQAITLGDAFSGGDLFGSLATVYVLTSLASQVCSLIFGPIAILGRFSPVATLFGTLLCLLPGFVVSSLFMLAPAIAVDQRISGVDALKTSIDTLKADWLNVVLFFFVLSLLANLGGFLCGFGVIFTLPLLPLSLALVYRDFFVGVEEAAVAPAYPGAPPISPANPWSDTPPPPPYNPYGTPPPGQQR